MSTLNPPQRKGPVNTVLFLKKLRHKLIWTEKRKRDGCLTRKPNCVLISQDVRDEETLTSAQTSENTSPEHTQCPSMDMRQFDPEQAGPQTDRTWDRSGLVLIKNRLELDHLGVGRLDLANSPDTG